MYLQINKYIYIYFFLNSWKSNLKPLGGSGVCTGKRLEPISDYISVPPGASLPTASDCLCMFIAELQELIESLRF